MKLIKTVQKYKMLSPGDHVLITVSGGADSVALLYGLLELKNVLSLTFSVCHINHNLRGKEAQKDAGFVKNLCLKLGIPLFSYSAKIDSDNLSLEEAARQVRYSFFRKAAKECGAKKIATGHSQNDNAETLLLRLCRGTGLTGLCGIPPVRKDGGFTFIRPLIETARADIEDYLDVRAIPYRTDQSNFDRTFYRNRVRLDILPDLEEINPQVISNLAKSAELLREDEKVLEYLTTEALKRCFCENRLHIKTLLEYPRPLQKRIIRAAIKAAKAAFCGLKDISYAHIAQIESLLTSQTGKITFLPGGLRIRREYENLLFSSEKTPSSLSFCYNILMDTPVFVPVLGHYVQVSVKNSFSTSHINCAEICTKHFNYDKIKEAIELRTRRPGDRIYIAGVGNKKLKNEFIDRKVPRTLRDSIPLLAIGSNILWIMDKHGRTSGAYAPKPGCPVLEVTLYERDS